MEKLECTIVYRSIPFSDYSGSPPNPTLTFTAILWASVMTDFRTTEGSITIHFKDAKKEHSCRFIVILSMFCLNAISRRTEVKCEGINLVVAEAIQVQRGHIPHASVRLWYMRCFYAVTYSQYCAVSVLTVHALYYEWCMCVCVHACVHISC